MLILDSAQAYHLWVRLKLDLLQGRQSRMMCRSLLTPSEVQVLIKGSTRPNLMISSLEQLLLIKISQLVNDCNF